MYIQKYEVDGEAFYVVSKIKSRDVNTIINIHQSDWRGSASGQNVMSVIKSLGNLKFSKDIKTKEPDEPEPESEESEKAKKKPEAASVVNSFVVRPIVEHLDKVASDLEEGGRPDLALAVDKISDKLEHRGV